MHLPPEDQPHERVLEAVAGEEGEVAGSGVVACVGEPGGVDELGAAHAQPVGVLVHFEDEEPDAAPLVLLVVVLLALAELLEVAGPVLAGVVVDCELEGEELAEVLREGSARVVARGQQQPVQQVDYQDLLPAAQVCAGALHVGSPREDRDRVLSDLDAELVADLDDRVGSHDLGETGDLPLFVRVAAHQRRGRITEHCDVAGCSDVRLQLLDRAQRGGEAVPDGARPELRFFRRAFDLVQPKGLEFLLVGRVGDQEWAGDVVFGMFDWRVAEAGGLFAAGPHLALVRVAVEVRVVRLIVGGL